MSTTSPAQATVAAPPLSRTPLHDLHVANGARMVPFAGYDMPLHYQLGVLKEHLHTRAAAGLFDVSHMGQIAIRPRSKDLCDTALALERLVPTDVAGLGQGRQRYSVLTAADGGILDDIMVANLGNHLIVIVNAATKDADLAHLRANMPGDHVVEMLADRALIALQGPGAELALAALNPALAAMRFMDVRQAAVDGIDCTVARSGYTGEDGFEISVPGNRAAELARTLLRDQSVALVGLGARDSLRLEAGLCLYGCDIDATTTPVEAGLEWSIPKVRRAGGARAGGFPGADVVLAQLAEQPRRRRVGLRPEGRTPVRGAVPLTTDTTAADAIGRITSGGYGPSLSAPIATGYVERAAAEPGTRLFAKVRGAHLPLRVVPLPFVAHRYRRG